MKKTNTLTVPTRGQLPRNNQQLFDSMSERLGWMPNMYAVMGQSETGLTKYLALENGKSSLHKRESEAVKLVVSKVNESQYCLAAHTYIAKMNGFAVEQIEEIKQGSASFDTQLDALVKLAKDVTVKRGKPNQTLLKNFFEAGFEKEHLIDTLIVIGDTTISNLVNCVAQTPIDDQWLLSLTDTHASGRNISSKSNQTSWTLDLLE